MKAPFVTWTEKMSVGVEALDADHKRLLDLLNDLHDGIAAGRGTERLGRVLDGLMDYTATHFAREEEFFARTGYPAAPEHIHEHETLTGIVHDIQVLYNHGKFEALSLNTLDLLKSWLADHIQGSDKKYGPHLNACGIF